MICQCMPLSIGADITALRRSNLEIVVMSYEKSLLLRDMSMFSGLGPWE